MTQSKSLNTDNQPPLLYWKTEIIQMKKCAGCRDKTLKMYELSLQSYINFVGKSYWPPTRIDVMNFLDNVRSRGVSEETVATYWRYLRSFLNYIEILDGFGGLPNPASQISKLRLAPKLPESLPKAIPLEHIEKFFAYLQTLPPDPLNLRDLALFRFLYTTGCRSGEAAGLCLENIDLDNQKACFPAKNNKTHTERVVCFNQICGINLQSWLDCLHKLSDAPSPFVFPSMKNNQSRIFPLARHLTVEAIYHILQKRLSEAGLPSYPVHAIRHTFANHTIHHNSGKFGLGAVQKQMGHKSAAMTLRYSSASTKDQEIFKYF